MLPEGSPAHAWRTKAATIGVREFTARSDAERAGDFPSLRPSSIEDAGMPDREVLDADACRHLIVRNAVDDGRQDTQPNDPQRFHGHVRRTSLALGLDRNAWQRSPA